MDDRQEAKPYKLKREIIATGTGIDEAKTRTFGVGDTVHVFDLGGLAWLCRYADRVFYEAMISWDDLVAA